jgi:hypothetical protein
MVVRRAHSDLDGDTYHEPVWLGESVLRDRLGRRNRHGSTRWVVVVCNNPKCVYEALVNVEAVCAAGPGLVNPIHEADLLRRAATAARNIATQTRGDTTWFSWVPNHLDGLAERLSPPVSEGAS